MRASEPLVRLLGEAEHPARLAPPQVVEDAGLAGDVDRVLAHGLELADPGPAAPVVVAQQETAVEEDAELADEIPDLAHLLGRDERAAAREDGEALVQQALGRGQEPVAPVDRAPEGALPLGQVARAAAQQCEREPLQQHLDPEQRDAGGRQLDREREMVEPAAELAHGRRARRGRRVAGGRRPFREQHCRVVVAERGNEEHVLAEHPQGRAARRQERHARRAGDELREGGSRGGHMLDVVEQQQAVAVGEDVDDGAQRGLA